MNNEIDFNQIISHPFLKVLSNGLQSQIPIYSTIKPK